MAKNSPRKRNKQICSQINGHLNSIQNYLAELVNNLGDDNPDIEGYIMMFSEAIKTLKEEALPKLESEF